MSEQVRWRTILAKRWRTSEAGPFFDVIGPPPEFVEALPKDYLAAVAEYGGREGFVGETYLRLFRLEELVALNLAFEVPQLAPEVIVFGSDGGGEAFAFLNGRPGVVQMPFIPLSIEQAWNVGASFDDFIERLAGPAVDLEHDPAGVGMEAHAIKPLCLGGSPTDPENQVLVPISKYPEFCRFWNKVYRNASGRAS